MKRLSGRQKFVTRCVSMAVMGVVLMTTGCASTGANLYAEGREVYAAMREEVAELQIHIYDGEWDLGGWGLAPEKCGVEGYRFSFSRSTPLDDGWWLPQATTQEKADALMEWLDGHGWSGIRLRTYTGGVTSVTIEAKKPEAHVEDLLITLSAGTANDIVDLRVEGTCEPGSDTELWALMFPDGYSNFETPERAHPSVAPPFGLVSPSPEP